MSCLCKDVLESIQIPALMQPAPAPPLSPAAKAAKALLEKLTQSEPDVPPPEEAIEDEEKAQRAMQARHAVQHINITDITSLLTWVQLLFQSRTVLEVDLTEPQGTRALSRMAGTLNERVKTLAGLPLDFKPWKQLADLARTTDALQRVFDALDEDDGQADKPGKPDPLAELPSPVSWGGPATLSITVLQKQLQSLQVKFDDEFLLRIKRTAVQVTEALEAAPFATAAATPLVEGMAAIRSLRDTLGVDPLQTDPTQVRRMLADRFRQMMAAAARRGLPLEDPEDLPELAALPDFRLRAVRVLEQRLLLAGRVSRALSVRLALPPARVAAEAVLAASLADNLSKVLNAPVLRGAPCGTCDLRDVMEAARKSAALTTSAAAKQAMAFARQLGPAAEAAAKAALEAAEAAAANAAVAAADAAASSAGSQSGGDSDAGSSSGGGGGGGSGGGGGGGGVPATVMTAQLTCIFGVAPADLIVLPINRTMCGSQVAANIMDHIPMVNIMPFGMCTTISNPTVAAATAAAFGVLTPMPCIPATSTPWAPGAVTVLLGEQPMLDQTSICNCMWGGVIQIVEPGQMPTLLGMGGAGGGGGGGGAAAAVAAAKAAAATKASAAAASGAAAKKKQEEEEAAKKAAAKKKT